MWERGDKSGSANFKNVPVYNLNLLHSCRRVGGFCIYWEPSGSVWTCTLWQRLMKVQRGGGLQVCFFTHETKTQHYSLNFYNFYLDYMREKHPGWSKGAQSAANVPFIKMYNANQSWCFLFFTCLTYFWHSHFWFYICYCGLKAAYWQKCLCSGDQE